MSLREERQFGGEDGPAAREDGHLAVSAGSLAAAGAGDVDFLAVEGLQKRLTAFDLEDPLAGVDADLADAVVQQEPFGRHQKRRQRDQQADERQDGNDVDHWIETIPAKPEKARAMTPVVIMVTATPWNGAGMFA